MQTIQPSITTMTWLEFKERFLRFFCLASMRDNYKWQLLHIVRGEWSVEEFTHEFFRLSRYAMDVIQDESREVELYVIGLGPTYIGIWTEDRRLESVVEEAKQLERRHIMHGTIPDPYLSSNSGYMVTQGI